MPPSRGSFSKGRITLTGAEETLLLTLLARAKDAESPRPALNDEFALNLVSQIQDQGYDFRRTTAGSKHAAFLISGVCMRARMFDMWTEKFLARNPGPATVLHLACGMDTRSLRVKWQGEGRLWIDADRENAIELRRKMVKSSKLINGPDLDQSDYRLITLDIHSDSFLNDCQIPDQPVLILFEGLTSYLTNEEMYNLLRRIVDYFQQRGVHGEIHFDAVGPAMYFYANYWFNTPFKMMGTRITYYLYDPKALERRIMGLRFKERMFGLPELLTIGTYGWVMRFLGWLFDFLGISNCVGGGYKFEF
ncbi:o-methyltransferase domain protein [Colletotrichum incanum]|uniref:O-methyltransferase domain protein n=1 Tax=Colletotrichum incanum TaxID=1573173 RepID=A0A161Y3P7_COLIC|nr:o-methyltransferase domain protein [Colletotrichum incanum]OHW95302.1 o-methyltransferase domain protein [Colletotrichum incanum]